MDTSKFGDEALGELVEISGSDLVHGDWKHYAFVPEPLLAQSPTLDGTTYRRVADARAALSALDSTAVRLPNPKLFRRPALQAEAQSTSALEGTYAPLAEVLTADNERPPSENVREILNYVRMANAAFNALEDGQTLTIGFLESLQQILVEGTPGERASSGAVRDHQVVVGRRSAAPANIAPVYAARFIPSPPGIDLRARLDDLLVWIQNPEVRENIDPVVAAAMAHYQFETLHPFHDGNGRMGRLLIVVQLLILRVLQEPTLTVSPWFEARREEYYDALFSVSAQGAWDNYIAFFATGLAASATRTRQRMIELVDVQEMLKGRVRNSSLRAETALRLVDFAIANVSFNARQVQAFLGVSYGRANGLISQLVELGVLAALNHHGATRRFYSPAVLAVLAQDQ